MNSRTVELWVGIFMLAGIAALIMLAVKVASAGGDSGDSFELTARFENIGGLTEKAPVRVGGVKIGRVTGVSVDKDDYSAVVTMDIAAEYDNLPIDSSISVLTSGLLGSQFLGVEPGAEDLFLTEGDNFEFVQSALQLESLISAFLFSSGTEE